LITKDTPHERVFFIALFGTSMQQKEVGHATLCNILSIFNYIMAAGSTALTQLSLERYVGIS
jgi:hypothetical protein